jgi:2',3'-cyclic-nucleotide 2'-phosphodiesterase/3'-nucleotidase
MARALLRVLATSDVHMHLFSEDYRGGTQHPHRSLARLAHRIDAARSEAIKEGRSCLLLDNGDLHQGTALAGRIGAKDFAHIFEQLDYDALGLGNHDFDHGLDRLYAFAQASAVPVLSSNLRLTKPSDHIKSHVIVHKGTLKIGICSVMPPATLLWNQAVLAGQAEFDDILACAEKTAQALRRQGADIVITLAHTGIGQMLEENALVPLAASGAVDAIIGGHTHLEFPGPDHAELDAANMQAGTLHGIPTVMPGFGAAKLGCIDLDIDLSAAAPRVQRSAARLIPSQETDPADHPAFTSARAAHKATIAALDASLGPLKHSLSSSCVLVEPNALTALIAQVQSEVIAPQKPGSPFADLPLLSAVAPSRVGGRAGRTNYTYVPAGTLRERHILDISPFTNRIWAVRVSGAELRLWLEKSAIIFNCQDHKEAKALLSPEIPGFNFDTIYGLSYEIDLMQPPRFSDLGAELAPQAQRICNLTYQGKPVANSDLFLVAGTDYRLCGGGNIPGLGPDKPMIRTDVTLDEALRAFFASGRGNTFTNSPAPWKFAPSSRGLKTWFDTNPRAQFELHELTDVRPGAPKQLNSGLIRVPLTL